MAENTIDLQSLEIKPQSPKYSYIGLDENNELVRTDLNAGFANIIERTVYLTSIRNWNEYIELNDITEEQRAYNIETYGMSDGDNNPLITYQGRIFEMSSGHWSPSEGTGEVCFSSLVGDTMLLQEIGVLSIVINHKGDADASVALYDFYSKDEIDTKLENLVVGDVDLSNYYTKDEVDDKIDSIEIPEGGNGDVDLTGYATEQWVRQQGYVTDSDVNDYVGNEIGQLEEVINTKQDKITDLDTIRSGAAAGKTALQTIPSEYVTETELETRLKNIDVEVKLDNYYTKEEIDSTIGDINNILSSI